VIPLPVFLVNDKNCTDLNFSHFFCQLGLKMLGPSAVAAFHVEKDDQVIRHNNNKTWKSKEKSIWEAAGKHFCSKHKVNIVSKKYLYRTAEKYLFCFAGSNLFSLLLCLLFVYNFCHSPKKLATVSPFRRTYLTIFYKGHGLPILKMVGSVLLRPLRPELK
jgi:hypothetical protein